MGVFYTDSEPINDHIDFVDILASAYANDAAFLVDVYGSDSTYGVRDTSLYVGLHPDLWEMADSVHISLSNRVRHKLGIPFSQDPLVISHRIDLRDIKFQYTHLGQNSEFFFPFLIEDIHFLNYFSVLNAAEYEFHSIESLFENLSFRNCIFEDGFRVFYDDKPAFSFGVAVKNCELNEEVSPGGSYCIIKADRLLLSNNVIKANLLCNPNKEVKLLDNLILPRADLVGYMKTGPEGWVYDIASIKDDSTSHFESFHEIDKKLLSDYYNAHPDTSLVLGSLIEIEGIPTSEAFIENNSIQLNCPGWIDFNGQFKRIELLDNDFGQAHLSFNDVTIDDYIEIDGNKNIANISLERTLFSELKNRLNWEDINNHRLYVKRFDSPEIPSYLSPYYTSTDTKLYQDKKAYKRMLETYKTLYDQYKTNGFTPDANACYAEMKVLETRWWKQQYKEQPSFENYFRWKLNEFLNFFTDYGTNPAKAVVKSIWVILIFSVFYLFFPSDWDVSNRSELLKHGKELFSKNRYTGILANLGFLLYTGFIHALNAITLSMNAFTTLGFGDIPTRGAARYVTIVQGLIGWFLLTIFSVSLINQVLG